MISEGRNEDIQQLLQGVRQDLSTGSWSQNSSVCQLRQCLHLFLAAIRRAVFCHGAGKTFGVETPWLLLELYGCPKFHLQSIGLVTSPARIPSHVSESNEDPKACCIPSCKSEKTSGAASKSLRHDNAFNPKVRLKPPHTCQSPQRSFNYVNQLAHALTKASGFASSSQRQILKPSGPSDQDNLSWLVGVRHAAYGSFTQP